MFYRYFISLFILLSLALSPLANVRLDFDGDGKTDPVVMSARTSGPGTSQFYWHVLGSTDGYSITQWGSQDNNNPGGYGDGFVPADYDGDGKTDIAIVRIPRINPTPDVGSQLYWYILYSSTGTYEVIPWGLSISNAGGDYAVPADYDGDGKADVAIARDGSNNLVWWIRQSRDGVRIQRWGGSPGAGDSPVPADYDGDGKADLAVIRYVAPINPPPPYTWFILNSRDGSWTVRQLGTFDVDIPAVGDYDGDGKADMCVVSRRGDFPTFNWRWINSSNGQFNLLHWGAVGDKIVQGDYDGDGKTDQAIYRKDGNCEDFSRFWINGSRSGFYIVPFGGCGTTSSGRGTKSKLVKTEMDDDDSDFFVLK